MRTRRLISQWCHTSIFVASISAFSFEDRAYALCQVCEPCGDLILCVALDNGTGTVDLFASGHSTGCGVWGDANGEFMTISDGLPVGTTIECRYSWRPAFFDITYIPGGPLGGEIQQFPASLTLSMQGTGTLTGFRRTITLNPICQTHSGPRTRGDRVQSFPTEMFVMQGQLPSGDPDFDLLRINAGGSMGMPSPGHTTLTQLPGGNWAVDSFFDITYRIDFIGAPGGALSGMSGSTTGTNRAAIGGAEIPTAPTNAVGSANVPAIATGIVTANNHPAGMTIIDGLPPGTQIDIPIEIMPLKLQSIAPGTLGGPAYRMQSEMHLDLHGTGSLAGYQRSIVLPHLLECHVGQFDPAAPVQTFDTDMFMMQGQLPPGDPDFDLLRITAGNQYAMRSPGHTTLTRMPDGNNWHVDSFFDITYRIDFVGAPGGLFGGMSGSTTGTIRMTQGGALPRQTVEAHGLPHTALGASRMMEEEGIWYARGIGSSGEDGVSIDLTNQPNSGTGSPTYRGVQGWGGEIDFGGEGALPPGMSIVARAFPVKWEGPGLSIDDHSTLTISETLGGQGMISVAHSCDPACAGKLCECCPDSPGCATLTVELWNQGTLALTRSYSPPWPDNLVSGPIGTNGDQLPRLRVRTRSQGDDGTPFIEWTFEKAWPSLMSLTDGNGAADATSVVIRYPLATAPPMPLIHSVSLTGANVNGGGETGTMVLHSEGIHHGDAFCMQYRESDFAFASMAGVDDVNGDGQPDVVVSNLDSTGTNGIELFNPGSEPFDGWTWPWRSMASIKVQVRVLDVPDGSLPPNANLSFYTRFNPDGVPTRATVSVSRCPSGACADGDLLTFDFSELGLTSCEVEIVLGGQVVHAQATPLVYQIWSKIKKELSIEMERRTGGFFNGPAGFGPAQVVPRAVLRFTEPVEFSPSPGMLIAGDEIRFSGVGSGVDLYGLLDLQITGANICELAIVDVKVVPMESTPCPADIAPPSGDGTVGVPDLLAIINSWGPCAGCAADIAPPGGDGAVGVPDLLAIINNWGTCN